MRIFLSFILMVLTFFQGYSQTDTSRIENKIVILGDAGQFAVKDIKNYYKYNKSDNIFFIPNELIKSTPEWKKHKAFKIAGWSAFGVGTAIALSGGLIQLLSFAYTDPGDFLWPNIVLVATGGTLMLASVPLLIISNNYKKKARQAALSAGMSQIVHPGLFSPSDCSPALSFNITF